MKSADFVGFYWKFVSKKVARKKLSETTKVDSSNFWEGPFPGPSQKLHEC